MVSAVGGSEVYSIILQNKEKSNKELNLLYPNVSSQRFSVHRIQLIRKGLLNKVNELNKTLLINDTEKDLQDIINESLSKDNAYKDGKGVEKKDEIRSIVANYMKGLSGKVLSLPHIKCLCVKKVVALNNNLSFIGVDNSDNVINGMTATAKLHNLDLTPINGELNDVVKNYTSDSFVGMMLDYCGYMPKQASSFKYVIDNDLIVKGGYLFLTFQNAVRYYKSGYGILFEQLMKFNEQEKTGLTNTEFANDEFLKLVAGDKFKIIKKMPYQTGSPMIFYVLQRIR
jgi:hypothetical protein